MKFGPVALGLAYLLFAGEAAAQTAYVSNNSSNTVSVLDTATNTVVAAVPVGSRPHGVAVSPDGTRAPMS